MNLFIVFGILLSTRYDDYEIEAINSLLSEYEYDFLPIIIIYSQATKRI